METRWLYTNSYDFPALREASAYTCLIPMGCVEKHGLHLPLGTDILKDYSHGEMVSSKTMGDWRVHNGIDFTGGKNSQVLAIQSGTVKAVYTDEMWGTVVEIDHGNTMTAKYCGLKSGTTPKKGETVKNGQEIGELASIPVEAADGLHLHLEITVNGSTVDPLAAMNRAE